MLAVCGGADLGSLLADLGSLLGVSCGSWEKGCRQQLKTSKTAPLSSGLPVLPKRLPPFFRIQNRQQTRTSPRTASTDGGNLLGNTGKPLERGAIFEVSSCCRQLSTPGHQTGTQKEFKTAARAPKLPKQSTSTSTSTQHPAPSTQHPAPST